MHKLNTILLSSLISATLLTGCNSGTSQSDESPTGHLSVNITDAPIDGASNVIIKFTGLSIKPESGPAIQIDFADGPKQIDLLDLQGSLSQALLTNEEVNAGKYNWIRLDVVTDPNANNSGTPASLDYSYITIDGINQALYIPSGNQTGLKLNTPFTIPEDGAIAVTIDFDLRKSILPPNNNKQAYKLKPSLRLVVNDQIGHINGSFVGGTALAVQDCTENSYAVYLYGGHDITPDDIDDIDPNPVVTSLTTLNQANDQAYELGFVPAGNYTIAYTCNAQADLAESSEDVIFLGASNTSVIAGQTTTHNFE